MSDLSVSAGEDLHRSGSDGVFIMDEDDELVLHEVDAAEGEEDRGSSLAPPNSAWGGPDQGAQENQDSEWEGEWL